jgi:PilZ domain
MDSSMMTNQLTGNGHRWGQRIAVDIPVRVAAHASPEIHGHLRNLSLSGALIEADHELRLHAYIEVSFMLPETGRGAMTVMARITRELEGAIGLEWCEFAPRAVKDLLQSPSVRLPL